VVAARGVEPVAFARRRRAQRAVDLELDVRAGRARRHVQARLVLADPPGPRRAAAHPHAAALFFDYMLTDGQRFYTDVYRVPANKNYDSHVRQLVREGAAVAVVNAQTAIDDYDKWQAVYKKLIVDRSQQ
jgi:iron(III) transport system substrate-binding protein